MIGRAVSRGVRGSWTRVKTPMCTMASLGIVMYALMCCEFSSSARRVQAQEGREPAVQSIRASDIGNRLVIVGVLGLPLGEVTTIQGEWSGRDASGRKLSLKETDLVFIVSTVNGIRLEKPLGFRGLFVSPILLDIMQDLRPAVGDVWELRGIEIGGYRGVPLGVFSEPPEYPIPAFPYKFGFYTEFRYWSRRMVRRSQGGKESSPRSPGVESSVSKAIREL